MAAQGELRRANRTDLSVVIRFRSYVELAASQLAASVFLVAGPE